MASIILTACGSGEKVFSRGGAQNGAVEASANSGKTAEELEAESEEAKAEALQKAEEEQKKKEQEAAYKALQKEGDAIYKKALKELEGWQYYAYWKEDGFTEPILLVAETCFAPSEENNFQYTTTYCEAYMMHEDELIFMGQLEASGKEFPIAIGDKGIYCGGEHYIYYFWPNFETGVLDIVEGIEDEKVQIYFTHEVCILIHPGDELEKGTAADLEGFLKEYQEETKPVAFLEIK